MTRWTYGAEGEAFPVQDGETWKIGDHTFVCGDLMAPGPIDSLIRTHRPDLMYTDPPWGQGLLNGFRTKAGLDKAEYRWEQMYERIEKLAQGMPLWIEGSKPSSGDGQKILAILHETRSHVAQVQVKYYGKHPSGLFYGGRTMPARELFERLNGMDDDHTPGEVMRAHAPRGLVVDPCGGRGQTSREAERSGWASINLELNRNRVSAALARMQNLTGLEPHRVA